MSETNARMHQLLSNAKAIALTDNENKEFLWMNAHQDWSNLGTVIAQIGERAGIVLSSGRVAHDAVGKRLLIVD